MKLKPMWMAYDGRMFTSRDKCESYEKNSALKILIANEITATYSSDAGYAIIEEVDVEAFISNNWDDLVKIMHARITTHTD